MSFRLNPSVFREYDIRGIAGEDLSEDFAECLGYVYGLSLPQVASPAVAVGEDCRPSSFAYGQALIRGIRKAGVNVVRFGMCPTPATYFGISHLNLDGGVMVTASHLASRFNGFKICVGTSALYGAEILELRGRMQKTSQLPTELLGSVKDYSILPPYVETLLQGFPSLKRKKIVVDCGNGNGSQIVPQVLRQMGAEVFELYCEVDGTFPNHIPDPSKPENNVELIAKVKEIGADLGIGIDGDADRIGVVDENGKMLFGDELLVIFSRDILQKFPGATVVSEVKASSRLFDDIQKNGGHPIMWRTGHSLIEAKMKETGAVLGGEMSGHMYFADRYLGFDDAVYAAMRVYEVASEFDGTFSGLLIDLPPMVSTPELRIECPDDEKFRLVKEMKRGLVQDPELSGQKFTVIDGVRIDFQDGWGLVRASNTEPALSMRFEAKTSARLDEIKSLFLKTLESAKKTLGSA